MQLTEPAAVSATAVQAAKSLRTWQRVLIKSECPRDTAVLNHHRCLRRSMQHFGIPISTTVFIVNKPTLNSAIDKYRNVVRNASFTGKYAPH
ncbi:integrase domain-containing protein [Yersinia enterocolitica]